jgi:hypothetical protein
LVFWTERSAGLAGIGLAANLANALFIYHPDAVSVAAKDAFRKIRLFAFGGGGRCGGFQRTAAPVAEEASLQDFGSAGGARAVP